MQPTIDAKKKLATSLALPLNYREYDVGLKVVYNKYGKAGKKTNLIQEDLSHIFYALDNHIKGAK
jgi:hypothetical protein